MPKKKTVGQVVAARAVEPSTHAGAGVLAAVIGGFFPQYALLANALAGVFGAVAVALPEVKKALP